MIFFLSFLTGMDDSARDVPPSVWLIMMGDALHSLIAGLAIGTAFSVNIFTGLSVGIAIVLEQLPHELGNYVFYLRNRASLKVNCRLIIHCLEVICKEDKITSAQSE